MSIPLEDGVFSTRVTVWTRHRPGSSSTSAGCSGRLLDVRSRPHTQVNTAYRPCMVPGLFPSLSHCLTTATKCFRFRLSRQVGS